PVVVAQVLEVGEEHVKRLTHVPEHVVESSAGHGGRIAAAPRAVGGRKPEVGRGRGRVASRKSQARSTWVGRPTLRRGWWGCLPRGGRRSRQSWVGRRRSRLSRRRLSRRMSRSLR